MRPWAQFKAREEREPCKLSKKQNNSISSESLYWPSGLMFPTASCCWNANPAGGGVQVGDSTEGLPGDAVALPRMGRWALDPRNNPKGVLQCQVCLGDSECQFCPLEANETLWHRHTGDEGLCLTAFPSWPTMELSLSPDVTQVPSPDTQSPKAKPSYKHRTQGSTPGTLPLSIIRCLVRIMSSRSTSNTPTPGVITTDICPVRSKLRLI